MYYLKSLLLYSLFGFCMESTVYKISLSSRHSGICYGPFTYVYGFGVLSLILLKKYFLDKLKVNKYWKVVITFISCALVLTLIEWLGGNILNMVFDIDMWNYTKKTYNFGKYICLELAFIWGLFGTLYVYYIKNFIDKIIAIIPDNFALAVMIINTLDIILVFINKL